ncbi:MAG: GAF domain-containing protein, partial [Cyclobacteriaceae bacterium]
MKKKFRSEYFLLSLIIVISGILIASNYLWLQRLSKNHNHLDKIFASYIHQLVLFENQTDLYYFTGNFYYFENINHKAANIYQLIRILPQGGEFQIENESFHIEAYEIAENDLYKNLLTRVESLINTTDKFDKDSHAVENYSLGGTTFEQNTSRLSSEKQINDLKEVKTDIAVVLVNLEKVQELIQAEQEQKQGFYKLVLIILQFTCTAILIFTLIYFRKKIFTPARNITSFARNLAEGRTEKPNYSAEKSDLNELDNSLQKLSRHINDATNFAISIGEGKVDKQIEVTEDDMLGKALLEMRDKLKEVAEEESKRNWAVNGMAKFSEILRQYQHSDINELSYQFVFALVKYLEGNQGGVFLINEEQEQKFIELTACYAYERRKKMQVRLEMEEGLIGQCILEKDLLYIEEVPDNYVNITSGLGKKKPTCLLIVPIKVNEEIFGAIEIAFFSLLPK